MVLQGRVSTLVNAYLDLWLSLRRAKRADKPQWQKSRGFVMICSPCAEKKSASSNRTATG
ncbi:MAG: hypothetical protein HW397_76 [Dehalococcoidia bacterium]|nr:hypothetical protein [Dehalococcoidia bacterium]